MEEQDIYTYRVRTREHHLLPVRTWQAEWDNCGWCPRAFTERGVLRKAARWRSRSIATADLMLSWHRWVRAYVTQRSDEFYKRMRSPR